MNALMLLIPLLALVAGESAMAYEQPKYEVVRSTSDFELRQYASYAVAETIASGDFDDARNAAFLRLFDYISGNNRAKQKIEMSIPVISRPAGEKIEMTVPVMTRTVDGTGTLMHFVLPSRFGASTAPEPVDSNIRIRDVGGQLVAARRYSGRTTENNYRDNERKLLDALSNQRLVPTEVPRFAVYNGPFTPWFLRRNEVLVPVERRE